MDAGKQLFAALARVDRLYERTGVWLTGRQTPPDDGRQLLVDQLAGPTCDDQLAARSLIARWELHTRDRHDRAIRRIKADGCGSFIGPDEGPRAQADAAAFQALLDLVAVPRREPAEGRDHRPGSPGRRSRSEGRGRRRGAPESVSEVTA